MTCAGLMPRGYVTVHETANRGVISLMHSLCFATENAIKLQSHVDFHGLNTKKGGKRGEQQQQQNKASKQLKQFKYAAVELK